MGTPAKIASSIAGSPCSVPGILMKRFGRPARACRSFACASVVLVSYASSGETSSETQPSTPQVRWWIGRKRSAASVRSSSASSKKSLSPDLPSLSFLRMAGSYARAILDGVVEDRRIRREARDRQLVDVPRQRAGGEQITRDVVEPEALTQIVEFPGSRHVQTPVPQLPTPGQRARCSRSAALRRQSSADGARRRNFRRRSCRRSPCPTGVRRTSRVP